jgi:hypothetical protein
VEKIRCRGGAICFDRETGEPLPNHVNVKYPPLGAALTRKVHFAPDGSHLLLECEENGERFLRRVQLNLTAAELARLAK